MASDRRRRVVHRTDRTVASADTGEVVSYETLTVSRLPVEPPFVKMYLDDLGRVLDLPGGPRDILYALVRKMDYDGVISLTAAARQRICDAHGIKPQTFANYLQALMKADVIRMAGRGEFVMNPSLFARGAWEDVRRLRCGFEMVVRYDREGGKTVEGRTAPLDG